MQITRRAALKGTAAVAAVVAVPAVASADDAYLVGLYRRWFRQFYSENVDIEF